MMKILYCARDGIECLSGRAMEVLKSNRKKYM